LLVQGSANRNCFGKSYATARNECGSAIAQG
jgi:hypothetical protein